MDLLEKMKKARNATADLPEDSGEKSISKKEMDQKDFRDFKIFVERFDDLVKRFSEFVENINNKDLHDKDRQEKRDIDWFEKSQELKEKILEKNKKIAELDKKIEELKALIGV